MPKVFVGMSGGIDSSVTAHLLKEQGYDVTGVTFLLNEAFDIETDGNTSRAANMCEFLGIPHQTLDLRHAFRKQIVDYFVESYQTGLTPNPCVFCNRGIKFGAFLNYSLEQGADFISTGHYIRLRDIDGERFLRKGADPLKDQSYFLALSPPESLRQVIFPLGEYIKTDVVEHAKKNHLPLDFERGESQDVCFIEKDYRDYLRSLNVPENPGDFILNGKIVGKHHGIPFYSFGQRRGLGVSVGKRLFVRDYDIDNNRIILGEKPLSRRFTIKNINSFTKNFVSGRYDTQVRYQSRIVGGNVTLNNNTATVELDDSHEIIAPGQIAVFYRDDLVFAGGEIDSVEILSESDQ